MSRSIIINKLACDLALVTRAHDFLTSTDSEVFLRGARAFTLQHPPMQRVADVSERIEDLSDIPDADIERMKAIRDAARAKNEQTNLDNRRPDRASRRNTASAPKNASAGRAA